jgi:predicted dehydrogenase
MTGLRAAVVGTGFIGVVHVEALRRIGIEVTGVVGSSPERARQKPGLPQPYDSFEAMLADERVDVVHLTTPNNFHYAQVKDVLAAGKHVVCEKPLALTSEESGELLRLAEESGLVHCTNYNIRFYPLLHEARERVRRGDLGQVWNAHGTYIQDWLHRPTDWNWRLDPELGGSLRAVADIGTHWFDLTGWITGRRVAEVLADLFTVHPVRRIPTGPVETYAAAGAIAGVDRKVTTEDVAHVLLRYEDGTRGQVTISQVSAGRKNHLSFEVDGSQGALAWNSERHEELWVGHRDRPSEQLVRDPSLLGSSVRGDYPGGHPEGFPDTFKHLYRAVYRAVEAGGMPDEPDFPTFADGHEEMLLCEAVAKSARARAWTEIAR